MFKYIRANCALPLLMSLGLIICSELSFGQNKIPADIQTGAQQMQAYLPLLENKKVALVINQTSIVGNTLLLDTLLQAGINVVKIFVPEHGFRGTADAGAHINNETDAKTGLPVVSLYGNNKKPSKAQLNNVDIILYDLQDVGVRFYTYISTLQYMMDACIENKKQLIVLDRPNPNGHIIDGPVLDTTLRSFVGMQPIPVLYGMTAGEYATLLKGEKWIRNANQLDLKIIACKHYSHSSRYTLPVAPSPNLKTMTAVYLYPGLCFFEGTNISVGRGTDKPFQQWGNPDFAGKSKYFFIPKSVGGASKPLYENQKCFGAIEATNAHEAWEMTRSGININALLKAYIWSTQKDKFFNSFFEKLAGTKELREQIIAGKSEKEIRDSWVPGLQQFKKTRAKYLLYED